MKKQLIKIKLNSLYGNHAYKGDVKNKVYFPTPVLFINYLLKHILLYADTDIFLKLMMKLLKYALWFIAETTLILMFLALWWR
jgi:hypothetical protein